MEVQLKNFLCGAPPGFGLQEPALGRRSGSPGWSVDMVFDLIRGGGGQAPRIKDPALGLLGPVESVGLCYHAAVDCAAHACISIMAWVLGFNIRWAKLAWRKYKYILAARVGDRDAYAWHAQDGRMAARRSGSAAATRPIRC